MVEILYPEKKDKVTTLLLRVFLRSTLNESGKYISSIEEVAHPTLDCSGATSYVFRGATTQPKKG